MFKVKDTIFINHQHHSSRQFIDMTRLTRHRENPTRKVFDFRLPNLVKPKFYDRFWRKFDKTNQ